MIVCNTNKILFRSVLLHKLIIKMIKTSTRYSTLILKTIDHYIKKIILYVDSQYIVKRVPGTVPWPS